MYRLALGGLLSLVLLVYWFSRGGDAAPSPATPSHEPAPLVEEASPLVTASSAPDAGLVPNSSSPTEAGQADPDGPTSGVSGAGSAAQRHIGEPLDADDPLAGYTEAAEPLHIGEPLDADDYSSDHNHAAEDPVHIGEPLDIETYVDEANYDGYGGVGAIGEPLDIEAYLEGEPGHEEVEPLHIGEPELIEEHD